MKKKNEEVLPAFAKYLNEIPATPSQIINAGWIDSIDWTCRKFEKMVLEDSPSLKRFMVNLKTYRGYIEYNDKLLMRSIETSLIHSFFHKGKDG